MWWRDKVYKLSTFVAVAMMLCWFGVGDFFVVDISEVYVMNVYERLF